MVIVNVLALVLLILWIAECMEISMVKAWPIGVSVLMIILYGLSFGNVLNWIDWIGIVWILAVVALLWKKDKKSIFRKLCEPSFLIAFLFVVLISLLVREKCVSWWDEINFWAADAKSIFYRNGFAAKYENVSPEYGDYPPGTQLIKWWFLHMSPKAFDEGLMFAGYYFLIFSFLLPSLDKIKLKNRMGEVGAMLFWCGLLWLFPTTVEVFWCDGSCADLSMAVIYGAFLVEVVKDKQRKYTVVPGLYLACLSLCKNTAAMWLLYGAVFLVVYEGILGKWNYEFLILKAKSRFMKFAVIFILPMITYGSWWSFCLINRRVAAHTGNAIHMATGSLAVPEYQSILAKTFATAFAKWPLHRYENGLINLSPLAFLLFFSLLFFALPVMKKTEKKKGLFLGIFTLLSGLVFYGFNLICHLTIFAEETQYLEPFAMVSSIERYGAPFTIGTMMVVFEILSEMQFSVKKKKTGPVKVDSAAVVFVLLAAFILLTCDYSSAFRAIYGYRKESSSILESRKEIVGDEAEKLKAVYPGEKEYGRVLYLRDMQDYSWVRNTYISYEMSPVSMMYRAVDPDAIEEQEMLSLLGMAHARYLYYEGKLYKTEGGKLIDATQ